MTIKIGTQVKVKTVLKTLNGDKVGHAQGTIIKVCARNCQLLVDNFETWTFNSFVVNDVQNITLEELSKICARPLDCIEVLVDGKWVSPAEITFPCFMVSNDQMIVYMVKQNPKESNSLEGYLIHEGRGAWRESHRGQYVNCWDKKAFRPFSGQITV